MKNSSDPKRREPTLLERFLVEAESEGAPIDAAETLALAASPLSLAPAMRMRLTDALETTHRFDDLEHQVAELADLSIDQARELLLCVDAPSTRWDPGPTDDIALFNFEGGERVRNAVTGFVRHAPGTKFPEHDHVGGERVLVLQGAFEDSDGVVYASGEIAERGPASPH